LKGGVAIQKPVISPKQTRSMTLAVVGTCCSRNTSGNCQQMAHSYAHTVIFHVLELEQCLWIMLVDGTMEDLIHKGDTRYREVTIADI
jgi:metal-responsive CopG/Arc/MetJ family transcriptional regulator